MIILKPERSKKRSKNWRKIKKKLPALVIVSVFAGLVYLTIFSPVFKIKNVSIEGNKNIPFDLLRGEVEANLQDRIFFVLPSDSLFIFSLKSLENDLREKFKRIETIHARKIFFDTLRVSLTEKRGAFKWCRQSGCFLINEQGMAYNFPLDESMLVKEEKSLLTITESAHGLPGNNEKIVNDAFIQAIWKIHDELGDEIAEFTTPSVLSNKIVIKMKEGWQTVFTTNFPIEDQLVNFKTLFSDEITLEQKLNLEYIDLTVEGRAYYKFKNEDLEVKNDAVQ